MKVLQMVLATADGMTYLRMVIPMDLSSISPKEQMMDWYEEDLVVLFIFMTCLKSTDVGMYEGIVDGASDSKGDSVGGVDGWTGRGTGA